MLKLLLKALRIGLDVKAASKGVVPLAKRYARRRAHRRLAKALRKL